MKRNLTPRVAALGDVYAYRNVTRVPVSHLSARVLAGLLGYA